MRKTITEIVRVFETPWFALVGKRLEGEKHPYYSIQTADYVCVLALDGAGNFILVRQYRPAVDAVTVEFPSGHADGGMTPEQAAKTELLEETGYESDDWALIGCLHPDTGRLGNRMWVYFAGGARPVVGHTPEAGIEVVTRTPVQMRADVLDGTFNHAIHIAALTMARLHGRLPEL